MKNQLIEGYIQLEGWEVMSLPGIFQAMIDLREKSAEMGIDLLALKEHGLWNTVHFKSHLEFAQLYYQDAGQGVEEIAGAIHTEVKRSHIKRLFKLGKVGSYLACNLSRARDYWEKANTGNRGTDLEVFSAKYEKIWSKTREFVKTNISLALRLKDYCDQDTSAEEEESSIIATLEEIKKELELIRVSLQQKQYRKDRAPS